MELSIPQGLNSTDGGLDEALGAQLTRTLRNVVQNELYRRRSVSPEDIEDVTSDAMVALLAHLERSATDSALAASINDLDAYAAGIARRACSAWSRRRYPAFHRLRIRLRYLLKADPRFFLQPDDTGHWTCGLTTSRNAVAHPADPDRFTTLPPSLKAPQAVAEIFTLATHPLFFNDLAKICAHLWAIEDTPETLESIETASSELAMEAAPDRTARLAQLWSELQQLPQRQCAALLLNLRAADGDCATALLVLTGTASLRSIATVLGIEPAVFAELWPRLPISDLEIAERLNLTRQQVINLRKCARERLFRRMGP